MVERLTLQGSQATMRHVLGINLHNSFVKIRPNKNE